MVNKKGVVTIETIAGILIIAGGILYVIGNGRLGLIPISMGLLIEAIVKYMIK